MKLITFTVPCYNSQGYMRHCIDTLLAGGEDVEIIIVNDGSRDDTAKIADEYLLGYPTIIKVVHKANGGHGSGVNSGIKAATGLYFKVVDSDDWVDVVALKILLDTLKNHIELGINVDLYVTNFVYEHASDNTSFTRKYTQNFAQGFNLWRDTKTFKASSVLLMHSLLYRTQSLVDSNTILPEHTFYVDNLYAYKALPSMKTLFYLDVDLYRYFIGRVDQSVNINNFVKNYEQQIRVMRLMTEAFTYNEIASMEKGLKKYMFHCLATIMINTIFFTGATDSPERRAKLKNLWNDIKSRDKKLYMFLRYRSYPMIICSLPWKLRGKIMVKGYRYLCKKIKLG